MGAQCNNSLKSTLELVLGVDNLAFTSLPKSGLARTLAKISDKD
jgi:hypothetical protein